MTSPRRARFVTEYVIDFNAAQAAIRAGYSARSASSAGARLLRDPKITAAIDAKVSAEERRIAVSADRVVLELMRVAFSDIRTYVTRDPDGLLCARPRKELTQNETAAIARVAPGAKGRHATIRLHDKKHALGALARHVGFFERRAFADPKTLHDEAAAVRARLFAAAGLETLPALAEAADPQT